MTDDPLARLLHPRRYPNASHEMGFIMSQILQIEDGVVADEDDGSGFVVTSDGFVVAGSNIVVGDYGSFRRNVEGYVAAAGLTGDQLAEFWRRFDERVRGNT